MFMEKMKPYNVEEIGSAYRPFFSKDTAQFISLPFKIPSSSKKSKLSIAFYDASILPYELSKNNWTLSLTTLRMLSFLCKEFHNAWEYAIHAVKQTS